MKKLSQIIMVGLLALMPVALQAQSQIDRAVSKFVSEQGPDKTIAIDKSSSLDTLNGKHAFSYACYSFTVKGKAQKEVKQLVDAFNREQSHAYTMLVKPINAAPSHTYTVDMDGNRTNIEFGTKKEKYYQVLFFHDASNPLYRYAYALLYGPATKKSVSGSVYVIYSRDPNTKKSSNLRRLEYDLDGAKLSGNIVLKDGSPWLIINGDTVSSQSYGKLFDQIATMRDSLSDMGSQMGVMSSQMSKLARNPVKNAESMEALGARMDALGSRMDQLGGEIERKCKSLGLSDQSFVGATNYGKGEGELTKLNNSFGTYYNLYVAGLEQHQSGSYMTSLVNHIYSLTENAKLRIFNSDIKSAWVSGIMKLEQLDSDVFRKGVLNAALKNLKK